MAKKTNNGIPGKAERFEKTFRDFFSLVRGKDGYRFLDTKITEAQFVAMMFLRGRETSTMTDLRNWMGIHMSTLTGIVDRMVRDGLVKRFRDDKDRRLVIVTLTKKGISISAELWKVRRQRIETLLRLLNDDDQMLLIDTFERLTDNLRKKFGNNTEVI